MLKYLLLAIVLIWLFYSPALRGLRGRSAPRPPSPPTSPPPTPKAESMVQCAHCGLHLPQGEALQDEQGRRYCSAGHLRAGPASS